MHIVFPLKINNSNQPLFEMKSKLVFSTENKDIEHWIDLPFVPRVNEWLNVQDYLQTPEINNIKENANCWSGIRGVIEGIEYRLADDANFVEITVWCED